MADQKIELPNGDQLLFPAEMPDAEIQTAIEQEYPQFKASSRSTLPTFDQPAAVQLDQRGLSTPVTRAQDILVDRAYATAQQPVVPEAPRPPPGDERLAEDTRHYKALHQQQAIQDAQKQQEVSQFLASGAPRVPEESLANAMDAASRVPNEPGVTASGPERYARDFASGELGSTGALFDYLGAKTGFEPLSAVGKSMGDYAKGITPRGQKFADRLASGLGSFATFYIPGLGVQKGVQLLSAVPRLAQFGGATAMAGLESAMEAGSVYDTLIQQGKTHQQAVDAADKAFMLNAPVILVTDKIAFFNNFVGPLKQGLVAAGTNAVQEAYQQGVSNTLTDRPLTEGMGESALIGGIIGGGAGAAQGMGQSEPPTQPQPSLHDELAAVLSGPQKATEQPAEQALPEVRGTPAAPVKVAAPEDIVQATQRVNLQPTEAQKESGNYAKGHISWNGLNISIENPAGSERSGKDSDGEIWSVTMPNDYGYIKRTEGADGDHIDVYLGPNVGSPNVFIVDQIDPATGKFDEHKNMLGFDSVPEAIAAYQGGFSDDSGASRMGAITQVSLDDFKAWLKDGKTDKAVTYVNRQKAKVKNGLPTEPAQAEVPQEGIGEGQAISGGGNLPIVHPSDPRGNYGEQNDPNAPAPSSALGIGNGARTPEDLSLGRRHASVQPAEEHRQAERRTHPTERKNVAEMTTEELRYALLTDHLTDTNNRRAYEEAAKLPIQASVDVDSLKWVNDNLGHAAGDKLLQTVAAALKAQTGETYHISGDEFIVQGRTARAVNVALKAAQEALRTAKLEATDQAGNKIVLNGVGFSYGTGKTLAVAEEGLHTAKASRERAGFRAARGEAPPGAVITPKEIQNAQAVRSNEGQVRARRTQGQPRVQRSPEQGGGDLQQPASRPIVEARPQEVKAQPAPALQIVAKPAPIVAKPTTGLQSIHAPLEVLVKRVTPARSTIGHKIDLRPAITRARELMNGTRTPSAADVSWLNRHAKQLEQPDTRAPFAPLEPLAAKSLREIATIIKAQLAPAVQKTPVSTEREQAKVVNEPEATYAAEKQPTPFNSIQTAKQRAKAVVQAELKAGRITPDHAFRGTTEDELRTIAATERLVIGKDAEGNAGISAATIHDGQFPVYGKGVGYIVAPEHAEASGRAAEVLVEPKTDPRLLKYVVDGKVMSFDEMSDALTGLDFTKGKLEQKAGASYDVSTPAQPGEANTLAVRQDPESRDVYHVTAELVSVGNRTLPTKITTVDEAALAFSYMPQYAVEHYDAIVTDANGKPLAIIGSFKGAIAQASVFPATVLQELALIPGAKNIWASHNHPSGLAQFSEADRNLNANFAALLRGSGVWYQGLFAMTRRNRQTQFAFVDDGGSSIEYQVLAPRADVATQQVSVQERMIGGEPTEFEISDASGAKRYIPQISKGEAGIVLLSHQQAPVAFIALSPEEVFPLRENGRFLKLVNKIAKTNAGAAFLVNPNNTIPAYHMDNLAASLAPLDIRALDAITYKYDPEGGVREAQSSVEKGHFNPPPFFLSKKDQTALDESSFATQRAHQTTPYEALARVQKEHPTWMPAITKLVDLGKQGKRGGLILNSQIENLQRAAELIAEKRGVPVESILSEVTKGVSFSQGGQNVHLIKLPKVQDAIDFAEKHGGRLSENTDGSWTVSYVGEVPSGDTRSVPVEVDNFGFMSKTTGWTSGFYSPELGISFVNTDHLSPHEVPGILLHEILHQTATDKETLALGKEVLKRIGVIEKTYTPTAIQKSQAAQILTPEFKKWFGESKVVDAAGKPLVVYRGESQGGEFQEFDKNKTRENSFFFTADKDVARDYARGAEPRAFYLSADKVLDLTKESKESNDFIRAWADNWNDEGWIDRTSGEEVDPVDEVRSGRLFDYEGDWSSRRWLDLQASISAAGYNGAVLPDSHSNNAMSSIVVFEPTQIKSAIGNNGQFNPNNPSIVQSVGGRVLGDNIYARVKDRMEQAGVAGDANEAANYLVEEAMNMGSQAGHSYLDKGFWAWAQKALPRTALLTLKRWVAALRAVLYKHGIIVKAEDLRVDDIAQVAVGNMSELAAGKRDAAQRVETQTQFQQSLKTLTEDTKEALETAAFNYVDEFGPLEKWQKTLGKVSPDQDAHRAQQRYSGVVAARVEDFHDDMVNPLLEAIHASGLPYQGVEQYLYAKRAPSLNAEMEKINPGQTNLSGMTDGEAATIIQQAAQDGSKPALDAMAKQVYAITAKTRENLVQGGLITSDERKAWEAKNKNYVPLHRDEVQSFQPPTGKGFSIKGPESKRALGSKKKATNILAHTLAQHEASIIRAEKNKVSRAMFELLSAHPDSEVGEVDRPDIKKVLDKSTGTVAFRVDPFYKNQPHVLVLKIDGEEHTVSFNTKKVPAQRMAYAFKNLGGKELGEVTIMVGKLTRFLATMSTSANPVFLARNFQRDLQTAAVNLNDTPIKNKAQVFWNVPAAMRGFYAMSKDNLKSPWAKHAREFRDAGGQVGWMAQYKDIEDRSQHYKDLVNSMRPGVLAASERTMKLWWSLVEDANAAVENAVRLSAYVTLRNERLLELGVKNPHIFGRELAQAVAAIPEKDLTLRSKTYASLRTRGATHLEAVQGVIDEILAEASLVAKNLTVNFNIRGAKSVELNMWYMFAKASINGTARMFRAAKNPKVRKIMAGMVVVGFLMDALARGLAGDDDDDGENDYDQLPEYSKASNWVFWVSGRPVTIPQPYGLNFFPNVGRKVSQLMFQKGYHAPTAALDILKIALNTYSPVGSGGSLLQTAAPTIADPFIQLAENKNFAGQPIRKEQMGFGPDKPEYQMGFKSSSMMSQLITEWLNNNSGGNSARPGMINLNPSVMDFAVASIFGGAGKTYTQALSLPAKLAADKEIEAREVPFVNIFLSAKPQQQAQRKYHEALEQVQTVAAEYKDPAVVSEEWKKEHAAEIDLIGYAKRVEARIKKLNGWEKDLPALLDHPAGLNNLEAQIRAKFPQYEEELDKGIARGKRADVIVAIEGKILEDEKTKWMRDFNKKFYNTVVK